MSRKAVLFDCDGVLINTEEIGFRILCEKLAEYDFGYTREEYTELVSGVPQNKCIETVRADFLERKGYELPEEFGPDLWNALTETFLREAQAIEGIRELLQHLRDNNIPYAVCSNSGATELIQKLRATGLYDDFMPYIFSKDHVDNPKPAPDMYLDAAKLFGVKPEDCLVVEDSQTGTEAGVAAGMTVIGFVGEQHRCDHEAEHLMDAGAKLIALSHEQTWGHVCDFVGLTLRPPFYGKDLEL